MKINSLNTNLNNKDINIIQIDNNSINDNNKENTSATMSSSHPNLTQYQSDTSSLSMDGIPLLYSTLKCLANINYLTTSLLAEENLQKIKSDKNKYKLTIAYVEVIQNFENNSFIFYLQNFKNIILQKKPSLFEKNESNPKNLILYIIQVIHFELNISKNIQFNLTQIPSQYDFQSTYNYYSHVFIENNNSVISNLFYGSFNFKMQCTKCNFISHKIHFFNNLTFSLDEVYSFKNNNNNLVDIIECFQFFQRFDSTSIDCQICNICNNYFNYNSEKILITIPKILIINLESKGMQSLKLKFYEYLDISNFLYYKNNSCPIYYELIGIISNSETKNENKHYFSFNKNFKDQLWYKYDNNITQLSSFQEANTEGNPYILIYSKK
jgi:ubiquitin C-terminal hydrolase